MEALDILREKLAGNFYSRFSMGDTWDLYFDGFWLIAQEIIATEEKELNEYLLESYQPAREAVDKEDVAKSIVVSTCLRKTIVDVFLDSDMALTLRFENGTQLVFPTHTDIVDWQWALNEHGGNPYIDCIIGCFHAGEIHIGS
jgi:hypothetical protein